MRLLEAVRDTLWGWHTLLLILSAGVYFTLRSGFRQLRGIRRWLAAPFRGRGTFAALTAALGGSIGTGNIVGVALAISAGGPGALFWMWVSAFFGMMTVYTENALAARWQDPRAPGALAYLRRVKGWGGGLAAVYAAGCVLASLGMGNMAQTQACAAALERFSLPPWLTGGVLAGLVLVTALGGLGFALRVTEKLVPAMTLLFFAAALGVLWVFRENLPAAVGSIFTGAFSLKAGAGGTAGWLLAMRQGVSRGVFTNEAGLGSGTFAYAEMDRRDPETLGELGIFQVFLDTLVMCTVTGLCILCCRSPTAQGAQLCFFAFETALGPLGGQAVALCTALFAVATVTAWCCYGRAALVYLTGGRGKTAYAALAALAAFLGCVLPLEAVFQLGDAFNGLMALPNVLALFAHRGVWKDGD